MMTIEAFIQSFSRWCPALCDQTPWEITAQLPTIVADWLTRLDGSEYAVHDGVAIHRTAVVEKGVVLKPGCLIGPGCFVGAHAYLRNGVWLTEQVRIGPGCEVKTSLLMPGAALAHFNFVGDSIIGSDVNFEAGAVTANHYNERADKTIRVRLNGALVATGVTKFGALVGDHARIGANAVLSPGTILAKGAVVGRLQLINQEL